MATEIPAKAKTYIAMTAADLATTLSVDLAVMDAALKSLNTLAALPETEVAKGVLSEILSAKGLSRLSDGLITLSASLRTDFGTIPHWGYVACLSGVGAGYLGQIATLLGAAKLVDLLPKADVAAVTTPAPTTTTVAPTTTATVTTATFVKPTYATGSRPLGSSPLDEASVELSASRVSAASTTATTGTSGTSTIADLENQIAVLQAGLDRVQADALAAIAAAIEAGRSEARASLEATYTNRLSQLEAAVEALEAGQRPVATLGLPELTEEVGDQIRLAAAALAARGGVRLSGVSLVVGGKDARITVSYNYGEGELPELEPVPDVVGSTETLARRVLVGAGFLVGVEEEILAGSQSVLEGRVIQQSATRARLGETVTVRVGQAVRR